jgi:hypothetical protein
LPPLHGEPTHALDYVILSIRYFYDSGSFFLLPQALAACTLLLDRLGHFEPAAVSGFAATTYTLSIVPEMDIATAHLRDALGDQAYDQTTRPELN